MFELSNNNSRIKRRICSKLITVEVTDVVLVPSLLVFNIIGTFLVSLTEFEHVNAGWNTSLPQFKFMQCVPESDLEALLQL